MPLDSEIDSLRVTMRSSDILIQGNTAANVLLHSEARLAFAIDVSGSTEGRVLAAEKDFIRRYISLNSDRCRSEMKVLP